jgi:hypothetical protein
MSESPLVPPEARAGDRPGAPFIAGYPDRLSYMAGEVVSLACSCEVGRFSVEVARVGARREIVWEARDLAGTYWPPPEGASRRGCRWPEALAVPTGKEWPSGYYEVVLRAVDPRSGHLGEALAFFALRPAGGAGRPGRMLLVLATNTYNAYNDWGGPNLYTGSERVSFARPFAPGLLRKPEPYLRYANLDEVEDPDHERFRTWAAVHGLSLWSGSAGWYNWERPFVCWAERNGYQVDVAVSADLELHPEVVEGYPLVVSVGHDEYWSWAMRDTLEAFIEGGGNVAFFSGNAVCTQVRYQDGGATMVCYKDPGADPVHATEDRRLTTTYWCSQVVGRPENRLTGLSFSRGGYIRMGNAVPRGSGGYTVARPDHWAFQGTGLTYGDLFGVRDAITAYEVDGCELALSERDGLPVPTGRDGTPEDFVVLATAPARLRAREEEPSRYRSSEAGDLAVLTQAVFGDVAPEHLARLAHNHAVMGTYRRNGTVFSAGTTEWAYGLAGHDPVVERITRNVVDRMLARGKGT